MIKKMFLLLVIFISLVSCEVPTVGFDCEITTDVYLYNDASVKVNISSNTSCRVRIEWGDNSVDELGNPYQTTHKYTAVGEYSAKVTVTPDNQDDYKPASKNYTIKVFRITGYDLVLDWGDYPYSEKEIVLLRPGDDQVLTNTYVFQGYIMAKDFDERPVQTLINYLDFPEDVVLYVDYKIYTPHMGDKITAALVMDLSTQEYIIVGEYAYSSGLHCEGSYVYQFSVLLMPGVVNGATDKEVESLASGKFNSEEFDIDAQGMTISMTPCKSYSATEFERELSNQEKELIYKMIQNWFEHFSYINVHQYFPLIKFLDS